MPLYMLVIVTYGNIHNCTAFTCKLGNNYINTERKKRRKKRRKETKTKHTVYCTNNQCCSITAF